MTEKASVPVTQLAKELGLGVHYARQIACEISERLGFEPQRRQFAGSRQRQFAWTREQADRIIEARENDGFVVNRQAHR